jgi:pimeloyl-ACP methyl ester carboxylesterase
MTSSRYITVLANGLSFEVLEAGSGDRLALCLHGFPEHPEMWRPHIDTLVGLGYKVWAPSQRGYGKTSKPAGIAAYHVDHLVADVAALIDASGARTVTIVSHDWGAVVAWFFAMRKTRPLERLVIMNVPHPAVFAKIIRSSLRQVLRSWYIFAFQIPRLPEWLISRRRGQRLREVFLSTSLRPEGFSEHELDVYCAQISDLRTARAMLNWYRSAFQSNVTFKLVNDGVPQIEIPTLMIWGEDDHALGKETTYGTERYVKNLRLDYLAGCSHWVSQDAPERANERLVSFLGGVTSS